MSQEQLKSALNLMRRMPPSSTETSLTGLVNLVPELTDELLQRIDQPLKVAKDTDTGKFFVLCDYNRDADSYRSPWNNKYYPELEDGFLPSEKLRALEIDFNFIFDKYRQLYFEGGHSSVYLWDTEGESFAGCFLIHKDVENVRGLNEGFWNSIHVVEAIDKGDGTFEYKLTTTVIVSMVVKGKDIGTVDLSGHMCKQFARTLPVDEVHPHLSNIGKMVEEIELSVRNSIEGIYIQKTREVLNGIRTTGEGPRQSAAFTSGLINAVSKRAAV